MTAETQPERTGLAWQRTALGVLAVAGLIAHGAVVDGAPLPAVLSGGVALLGLALLAAATRRPVLVAVGIVVVTGLAAGWTVLSYA